MNESLQKLMQKFSPRVEDITAYNVELFKEMIKGAFFSPKIVETILKDKAPTLTGSFFRMYSNFHQFLYDEGRSHFVEGLNPSNFLKAVDKVSSSADKTYILQKYPGISKGSLTPLEVDSLYLLYLALEIQYTETTSQSDEIEPSQAEPLIEVKPDAQPVKMTAIHADEVKQNTIQTNLGGSLTFPAKISFNESGVCALELSASGTYESKAAVINQVTKLFNKEVTEVITTKNSIIIKF